jgi:hypothetical protein
LSILLETSDVTVWITDVSDKVLASCITYCEGELSRKGHDGKGVVAKRLFTTTVLGDLKGASLLSLFLVLNSSFLKTLNV